MKACLSILITSLVLMSCVKELPELPDNYDELFGTPIQLETIEIPCEDELISNFFSTELTIGLYDEFEVHSVSEEYDGFDSYKITTSHFYSNTKLIIEIPDQPNTFLGKKIYDITPDNYIGGKNAQIYIKAGSLNPSFFTPTQNDSLYVEFYEDSIAFNVCEVILKYSPTSITPVRLTGRIVKTF